jgi:Tol biopolymer transport system component
LEKDREARYQSASDLLADLKGLRRKTDSALASRRRWSLAVAALFAVLAAAGVWLLTQRRHAQGNPVERQITANPPENAVTGAAISPDGKYVAYADPTGLQLRSIDSGEIRAVSLPAGLQSKIRNLDWFPDGGKLLAEVEEPNGSDEDLYAITTFGAAAPQMLYRRGGQPAISPDGRQIAFVPTAPPGVPAKVAVLVGGINGESPRQLVTAPNVSFSSPVWSPDGRWIAYARISTATGFHYKTVIEVQPAGGGPAKTLLPASALPESITPCDYWANPCLRWSPDWRLVFSVSQPSASPSDQSQYSFWGVRVERRTGEAAAKPERLAHWSAVPAAAGANFGPISPTIAAGGKRLSFLKTYAWTDVSLGELAADNTTMTPPRRFTLDNRGSLPTTWTPDSKAIIFFSNRSGKHEIFRQGLDENFATPIVQCSEKDCDDSVLSPGGSWLLYSESTSTPPGAPRSPSRLMRRPTAGGSSEIVLEEPGDMSWGYRCPLRPGSPCVLSQYEGDDLVFYFLDPMQGRGEQIGKIKIPSAAAWDISADGSRLAVVGGVVDYQGRIEVLTLGDHAWHEVSVEPGWGVPQSVAWTADGKGFFVTGWPPLLLHVTTTGRVSSLLRNANQWMYGPLPSPDGKHLAFMVRTYDANVWMLENF